MAARTRRPKHNEKTREKIQTTQLINRLTNHVLGKLDKPMESSQVTAALGLLKKTLPDLSATNVQGDIFNHHFVVSSKPLSENEWEDQYASDLESTERSSKSTH